MGFGSQGMGKRGMQVQLLKMVTEESGSSGKELVIECSPEQKATKGLHKSMDFSFAVL